MGLPFATSTWPSPIAYFPGNAPVRGLPPSSILHYSSFIPHHSPFALLFLLLCLSAHGQRSADQRPPPLDPGQAIAEAKSLVAEVLAQKPEQNTTNAGQVRIRDRDSKEREVPARFEIICTPTHWTSIYEVLSSAGGPATQRLEVVHVAGKPNQYRLAERSNPGSTNVTTKQLAPGQTMIPFAGSDFWLADLGLEFLHWPEQRLTRKEMRHSKACDVLESINPHPAPGGYARVVSWINVEGPHGIIHADAYDANKELMKSFDPTNLEKINGAYQLAEMEMRNRKTGSQTWIKFDLSQGQ
jgi:hypothetical protein